MTFKQIGTHPLETCTLIEKSMNFGICEKDFIRFGQQSYEIYRVTFAF